MELKLNSAQQAAGILAVFAIGAITKNDFHSQVLIHLAATLGFGLILFYIFQALTKQTKNIWNTVISCLIIFLVLHYGLKPTDAFAAMIATFVVLVSKFFLEWKGSPIFNPVVLGLFVLELLALIFPNFQNSFTSWWGASYSLILIALWMAFYLKTYRKWALTLSYLIVFALGVLIFYKAPPSGGNSLDFLKFTFTDSTIYFFTFVMLAEPRTSPLLKKQQIIYGTMAGIISILSLLTNFPTSALLAILIPNFYFFITKWLMLRKMANA
ncbi:RnfABCDGE type electron transport complex subunit D [Candidatus Peregrinibacteria bacterium]|nr:RnfABCDGE type electron transport complex subunit D [Candidatus Peregrinibacteria bacterium]